MLFISDVFDIVFNIEELIFVTNFEDEPSIEFRFKNLDENISFVYETKEKANDSFEKLKKELKFFNIKTSNKIKTDLDKILYNEE